MNVPNPDYLKSLRIPGLCEHCRRPCRMRCGAHIFSVGAGRVDHPINIVQVGMDAVHDCDCHHRSHSGRSPSREDFLRIASKREGVSVNHITETVSAVRACPRLPTLAKSSHWLTTNFDADVAASAIEIIKTNYR